MVVKPGMVAHAYSPSIQEVEEEKKFKVILSYLGSSCQERWVWWCMPLIPSLGRQRPIGFHGSQAWADWDQAGGEVGAKRKEGLFFCFLKYVLGQ